MCVCVCVCVRVCVCERESSSCQAESLAHRARLYSREGPYQYMYITYMYMYIPHVYVERLVLIEGESPRPLTGCDVIHSEAKQLVQVSSRPVIGDDRPRHLHRELVSQLRLPWQQTTPTR